MATDAEKFVENAAVGASEEVAERFPGVTPDEAGATARSMLNDIKRLTRERPLVAIGLALCVGFLARNLSQ